MNIPIRDLEKSTIMWCAETLIGGKHTNKLTRIALVIKLNAVNN